MQTSLTLPCALLASAIAFGAFPDVEDEAISLLQARARSSVRGATAGEGLLGGVGEISGSDGGGGGTFFPSGPIVATDADSPQGFRYIGRFDAPGGLPRFDFSGFEIQFRVRGATEVSVWLSHVITGSDGWYMNPAYKRGDDTWHPCDVGGSQPQAFMVYVDGSPVLGPVGGSGQGTAEGGTYEGGRLPFAGATFDTGDATNGTKLRYVAATGLAKDVEHEVRIFKTSEAEWSTMDLTPNWVTFHGVSLDGGEVLPPSKPRATRRLELVGDSSSSGACNMDVHANGEGPRGSYAFSFPTRICERLGAECHSVQKAGGGIYANMCTKDTNPRPSSVPSEWERTVASDLTQPWDFKRWVPHGIVMSFAVPGDDPGVKDLEKVWRGAYTNYVKRAIAVYGPQLQVFLLCNVMSGNWNCPAVKKVVKDIAAEGITVHLFDLEGVSENPENCCGHPSTTDTPKLVDVIAPKISEAMTGFW